MLIRPYTENEFLEGKLRLASNPTLIQAVLPYFPGLTRDQFVQTIQNLKTVEDFQVNIIARIIRFVLEHTSDGLTTSGFQNISKNKKYVFISNHRDIICDPALFTGCLYQEGHPPPQICLGDNLLTQPWVVDLVKMNKGITVKRNLAHRELFFASKNLSAYILKQISDQIDSIWIAQREGRAINGNDVTQPGVIKMLTMEGEGTFLEKLIRLSITPIAISYEYDPCDALKARRSYFLSEFGEYKKVLNEDLKSMLYGIEGKKGRIHIEIGNPIDLESEIVKNARFFGPERHQLEYVVKALDKQIHRKYRLWPSNYVAFDLLNRNERNKDSFYSIEDRNRFLDRMNQQISSVSDGVTNLEKLKHYFLLAYANPVTNAMNQIET